MPVYLGLDLSTQSLTALAIEVSGRERRVAFEESLDFDGALPQYGTRHGVLPQTDPLTATSSPLMWAEALDRMMEMIARDSSIALADIRAISGSGQQHGSVYFGAAAAQALASLDAARSLESQMRGVFVRSESPIWMDSSTAAECAEITAAVGGPERLAMLTGSRAFERFTGPQIRKFFKELPAAYRSATRIHLVSSYAASLLVGFDAPIEPGDGSGMNLMDLARARWAPEALAATAPDLEAKLPPIAASWTVVGPLATYWRARHGFPAAKIVAWSGDNPCSLVGTGIVREGTIAISLGTSDTLFSLVHEACYDPSLTGHVFGSPTGGYMPLICCKNGSLAREAVRNQFGLDWPGFSDALGRRPAGNGGAILLPWFDAEITPTVLEPGARRYGLDRTDAAENVRAVVEAQMLSLAIHSEWMGVRVNRIHATGGASQNPAILQVMADVFGAEVCVVGGGNAAALGAALRAYHAEQRALGREMPWDEVVAGFTEPWPASTVHPIPEHVAVYAEMRKAYKACEAHALGKGPDPTPIVQAFARGAGKR
jgi:xylulokinase